MRSKLLGVPMPESETVLAMMRATHFVQHVTMSLRGFSSTLPVTQAVKVLSTALLGVKQLSQLCETHHHQRIHLCLNHQPRNHRRVKRPLSTSV